MYRKDCPLNPRIPMFIITSGSITILDLTYTCGHNNSKWARRVAILLYLSLAIIQVWGIVEIFSNWKRWKNGKDNESRCHNETYILGITDLILYWLSSPLIWFCLFKKFHWMQLIENFLVNILSNSGWQHSQQQLLANNSTNSLCVFLSY